MFTGIIKGLGRVISIKQMGEISRLYVETGLSKESAIGDSIAINGVCLTVVDIKDGVVAFDLSGETLRVTNLGKLKPGSMVNVEPSMKAGDSFGGHIVTGHVDCLGRIRSRREVGEVIHLEIEAPKEFLKYLVPKGSVAVDGISLTVVEVFRDYFTLVIIPHTARLTTLGFKDQGDTVNLEADIIGKYVMRYLESLPLFKREGVSLAD